MAITVRNVTLSGVPDTGLDGPEVWGRYSVEILAISGDGSAAPYVLSPRWIRQVDWVSWTAGSNNIVVNNAVQPPTITIFGATTLGSGATAFALVGGRPR